MTVTDKPVLVTGATGFVAYEVVKQLLSAGYTVRGTVRDPNNQDKLKHLQALEGAGERLSFVKADLLSAEDFPPAVEGCEYVIHTASPYTMSYEDAQKDLVDPAVQGTLNVMKACAGSSGLKRVVLTSSIAAVSDSPDKNHIYTEADWNTESSLKRNAYYYSKVCAEKAAWHFIEQQKPGFDLVVINPCVVIGPEPGPGVNTSNAMISNFFNGGFPAIIDLAWAFVDVRDVGKAHIKAMENPKAQGRHLCASELVHMKQVIAEIKEDFPELADRLPTTNLDCSLGSGLVKFGARFRGSESERSFLRTNVGKALHFDNSKTKALMGEDAFLPFRKSLKDTVEDLRSKGALEKEDKKKKKK